MKTITNSSMFIVPNSLLSPKSDLWETPLADASKRAECINYKMRKEELAPWGVEAKLDDVFVQVWIHCDEEDNLTDHGIDDVAMGELFPKSFNKDSDDDDYAMRTAPGFLPIRLFEGKKEGDSITLKTIDGVDWEIKLEQLPYRYGHFGKFEDALRRLIRKDLEDTAELERYAETLRHRHIDAEYPRDRLATIVGKLALACVPWRINNDYLDIWIGNKSVRALKLNDESVEVLQHNVAEAIVEYGEEFNSAAEALAA